MTKLVTAIGVTDIDGETKVRFTADYVTRSKTWARGGVDAELVQLPHAMDRLEALYWLQQQAGYDTPARARAILEQIYKKEDEIKRNERREKRQARKAAMVDTIVSMAAETAKTTTLAEIRARKIEEIL